jgi:hypothetical protein
MYRYIHESYLLLYNNSSVKIKIQWLWVYEMCSQKGLPILNCYRCWKCYRHVLCEVRADSKRETETQVWLSCLTIVVTDGLRFEEKEKLSTRNVCHGYRLPSQWLMYWKERKKANGQKAPNVKCVQLSIKRVTECVLSRVKKRNGDYNAALHSVGTDFRCFNCMQKWFDRSLDEYRQSGWPKII